MNKYFITSFIFPSVFIIYSNIAVQIGKDIFNSRIECNLLAIKNGLKILN